MKISRRKLLKYITFTAGALSCSCEKAISYWTKEQGQDIPFHLDVSLGQNIDPIFHLLSRAGYGPWPGELAQAKKLGAKNWLEEQLDPQSIENSLCNLRARRFETIYHKPGDCYEYKKPVLREEITRHTFLHALYSKRQLFEVMVNFWSDHLNIYLEKGDCIYLKASDDRLVIRQHALGNFRDLIRASAVSPAMLVYLDGKENKKSQENDIPNENYARELLELHTLGVHGGYTQQDVKELARCLTGWRIRKNWGRGEVYFNDKLHDNGEKQLLGHKIPAKGGINDLERVLDIVCFHPATAQNIASKLAKRFISDEPSENIIQKLAQTFLKSKGDIKTVLRQLFLSDEFFASSGQKFKRPFRYLISLLRLLGADTHAHRSLLSFLGKMGQDPFQYPTPDGYPDESTIWMGTMLWRWNIAFAAASNKLPSTRLPLQKLAQAIGVEPQKIPDLEKVFPYLIGRLPSETEKEIFDEYIQEKPNKNELLGLILASPAFQRY